MSLFFALIGKILPLYTNIVLGYVFGRFLADKRRFFVSFLFYFIAPFVFFCATLNVELSLKFSMFPLWNFIFGSSIAFFVLYHYKKYYQDNSINILAFTSGMGNTGYFGIPIAMMLFTSDVVSLYIFSATATILYESTTGYYVVAKGSFSARMAFKKVLKLPIFYALIFGLGLNALGFSLPQILEPVYTATKWLYGICGMMIIGMGLNGFKLGQDVDVKFMRVAYFYKFILWPLSSIVLILCDMYFFGLFGESAYKVLFLYSIVPLAGNTVTLAVLLNAQPKKASVTVLISTLISIVYIPLMLIAFDSFIL